MPASVHRLSLKFCRFTACALIKAVQSAFAEFKVYFSIGFRFLFSAGGIHSQFSTNYLHDLSAETKSINRDATISRLAWLATVCCSVRSGQSRSFRLPLIFPWSSCGEQSASSFGFLSDGISAWWFRKAWIYSVFRFGRVTLWPELRAIRFPLELLPVLVFHDRLQR